MTNVTVKYIGHAAAVFVGSELVKRGSAITIEKSIADGLLAQGHGLDVDGNPVAVSPQWKKATKKQAAAAAKKAADAGGGGKK